MLGRSCRVVALEPEAHAAELYEADQRDSQGASWTYMPYGPFETLEEYRAWMEATCSDSDPLFHAIVDTETERAVGVASYLRIRPAGGSLEVGHIHYSPALSRTAAATEAMFLMMERAFELGYRRYEWKCDALNAASCAAALRLGFTREGVFRQATVYKGRNRDTAWFSILDTEWPALREAFRGWLDPANFDSSGCQRRRLSDLIEAVRT
jgi:RimJ/RimL family protein N-acetyltransferase